MKCNSYGTKIVWTSSSDNSVIPVVDQEPWRSSGDITLESELPQQIEIVFEVCHSDHLHPYHIFLSDHRPLRMEFFQ
jgi:hypothetical protein